MSKVLPKNGEHRSKSSKKMKGSWSCHGESKNIGQWSMSVEKLLLAINVFTCCKLNVTSKKMKDDEDHVSDSSYKNIELVASLNLEVNQWSHSL